jgi:very-short-patch-repair endonuclease
MTMKDNSRTLRKNLTDAERLLWNNLRYRQINGIKFRRQTPIGKYIVDFVCFENNLIIEADGGQHNDNSYDKQRDAWLNAQGFEVLRFWNHDILENIDEVMEVIWSVCSRRSNVYRQSC